ncbi:MAG: uracil-DNA glycosylase [Defluviitaleaceae bacterium]|nr:uracil-DNA glycosylase [Defluviitaleaceae bacterium]
MVKFNNDWDALLAEEFRKDYYLQLREFLREEYRTATVFPDMHDIFNALKLTPYASVKAVIVGQDPYIKQGEAHGLAFSVNPGVKIPPSLVNVFKEIEADSGIAPPADGNLTRWAQSGVLLLNTVLTVRAGQSRSHAKRGWEQFTDAVLDLLDQRETPVAFLLWGRDAQTKGRIISGQQHLILQAAHPSPLAGGKFFGCKHFSQTNEFLRKNGLDEISW